MFANSPSHNFQRIQMATQCPFSKSAKIVPAPPWNREFPVEENLDIASRDLLVFSQICDRGEFDGWVLEIPELIAGRTIESLSKTVHRVLLYFRESDPSKNHRMATDFESPHWYFSYRNIRMSVITFSPCYDKSNSRYGFGNKSTFLLFQPDSSFDRFADPKTGLISRKVRISIRATYFRHGRPYDEILSECPYEAYRVVKPLHSGDSIVPWWK